MAGKGVVRVVTRCRSAQVDGNLDLSGCSLKQVPDALFLLMRNTELVTCDLSVNVMTRIPAKFGDKFKSLTDLSFSGNRLTTLPDQLSQMERLTSLDISHNHMFALPVSVYQLRRLETLNARSNFITDVDVERLRGNTNLRLIDLTDNPLGQEAVDKLLALETSARIEITFDRNELDYDDE